MHTHTVIKKDRTFQNNLELIICWSCKTTHHQIAMYSQHSSMSSLIKTLPCRDAALFNHALDLLSGVVCLILGNAPLWCRCLSGPLEANCMCIFLAKGDISLRSLWNKQVERLIFYIYFGWMNEWMKKEGILFGLSQTDLLMDSGRAAMRMLLKNTIKSLRNCSSLISN